MVWAAVGVALPTIALPATSTATHSDADGHETAEIRVLPSTLAVLHAGAPPAGLVDVNTSPAPSRATHNDTDGHATCKPTGDAPAANPVHAAAPPVGLADANTFAPPAPTHSDTDGQARSDSPAPNAEGVIGETVQADASPDGMLEVATFPR